jgi:protocatechuate 3,4-dioxygenase beta subunit
MTHRLLCASTVVLLACVGAALLDAAPQKRKTRSGQAAPATAFVLGRVVDAVTSRPVARATVTLVAESPGEGPATLRDAPRVLADGEGRFVVRGLAAGRYRFTATAPGYLDGAAGQPRPGGVSRPFAIEAGQGVGDLTIRLWREATIAGSVLDDAGAPVPGVRVSLLQREPTATGGPGFRDAGGGRTDDRGAYRISGVRPGTYVVGVSTRTLQAPAAGRPATRIGDVVVQTGGDGMYGSNVLAGMLPTVIGADGRMTGYPSTYHPSAIAISSATSLDVGAGDDRTGVDVHLRPVALSRVSGAVIGPSGPEAGIEIALIPAFAASQAIERTHGTISTRSDARGGFALVAVPPGAYRLRAWRRPPLSAIGREPLPPDTTLWSELPLEIGEATIDDLSVRLEPGATLSGRIRFVGSAPLPNPAQLQTVLSVAFAPPWSLAFAARMATRVTPAWEFTSEGLPPGRYVATLPNNFTNSLAARGWHFESIRHAGTDLTRAPIVLEGKPVAGVEVTFSDQQSVLSGVIATATGRSAEDAAVVAFPADHRAWIDAGLPAVATVTVVATQRGGYELPLRPGDYLVAAVEDAVLASWPNPQSVSAVAARATRVTIARGEQRRLDLRRN